MNASTQKRERVSQLCRTDLAQACKLAEIIEDDWFRIQAYASIIDACADKQIETYVKRAEKLARGTEDAFKVGALAWPIASSLRRGEKRLAAELANTGLRRASEIQPGASRVEAMFHIWSAVYRMGGKVAVDALESLEKACRESNSWRGARALYDVVLRLAEFDRPLASQVLERFPDSRYRRMAERDLVAGKTLHSFDHH